MADRGCFGSSFTTDCCNVDRQPHECRLPERHGGKHSCRRCKVAFVVGFGDDLTFARNWHTGTVHILWPQESLIETSTDDEVSIEALIPRARMMCGTVLTFLPEGYAGLRVASPLGEFDDADTCASCLRALGIDAPLAFQHPVPHQCDEVMS